MRTPTLTNRLTLILTVSGVLLAGMLLVLVGKTTRQWMTVPGAAPLFTEGGSRQQRVAENSVLRLQFPEPMDRPSTEKHLSLPEDLAGELSWDGDALMLDPSAPMPMGSEYTITVRAGAKRATGAPLLEDVRFMFVVAGAPSVSARFPAPGSFEVDEREASVVVIFDRPMIPLALVQPGSRQAPFPGSIEPQVPGRWRWLGTTTVEFVPEGGLKPASAYTVRVPKGVKSAAGDETTEDFTWSFTTRLPAVVSVEPHEGSTAIGPQADIRIAFNQDIYLPSVASHVRVTAAATAVALTAPEYGTIKQDDGREVVDHTVVVLRPATPMPLDSAVRIEIDPGIRGMAGDQASMTGATVSGHTASPLKLVSSRYEYGTLHLEFNNPLPEGTLDEYITLSPEIPGSGDLPLEANPWDERMTVQMSPAFAPSTAYTVRVSGSLPDAFGQKLGQDTVSTFTTPQLTPQVVVKSRGNYGIFEREKPPIYYVQTVNAKTLKFSLAKLTLQQFLSMRGSLQANYDAQPALPGPVSWDEQVGAKLNEWAMTPVDISKKLKTVDPGIYVLTVQSPEYRREWYDNAPIVEYHFFSVTDLAIALKYSGHQALAFVTNTQTGDPVADAVVRFHALNGDTIITATTDDSGFAETSLNLRSFGSSAGYNWEPEFWVTAEKDGDRTFVGSDWQDGIRPYDFGMPDMFRGGEAAPYDLYSFFYTDRPVYRAGDTVHFKGIVRLKDASGVLRVPPRGRTMEVMITDPEQNEVFNRQLTVSADGAFSADFTTDADASLGYYGMSATLIPDNDTGGQSVYHQFQVLAYRKPEYKVDVAFGKEEYMDGDRMTAQITGSYYFGAPMNNADVQWRAISSDYYFNKFTGEWYAFSAQDSWCWYDCAEGGRVIAEGKGTLDALGHLDVSLDARLNEEPLSQIITLEADITDPNNQTVSNRSSVILHKSSVYVGIKPEDWVAQPGRESRFHILTLAPDGSPVPGRSVTLTLLSRTWTTVRAKGVDGEYYYENETEDKEIRSISVRTDENGKGVGSFVLPSGGEFVVLASAKDDNGRSASASTSIYAWSDAFVHWPSSNNDKVDVIADKKSYVVGDTATLLVKSPYQGPGVKALVTIEREGILQKHVLDVPSTSLTISVPITDDFVPDAYVSVIIIKPRQGEAYDDENKDTGLPAFKIGYARLQVDASGRRLGIRIAPDKQRYLPGETVEVILTTTNAKGTPVSADVSLSAVDTSVLALTGFTPPDPLAVFFGERGLGVHTAHTLMHMLERFKPGSKGGGGDSPETRVRGNFKDTAFWQSSIQTDATGTARVTFQLPDNLTTWQLLAIGHTADNLFGEAHVEIVETKNVLVRPMRPRFAVQGDRVMMGAIVHNEREEDGEFTVSLEGTGFTHEGKQTQTVKIPAGDMATVTFPVLVGTSDTLTLRFAANGEGATDTVEESIPVEQFGVPQTVAVTGVIDSSQEQSLGVERIMLPPSDAASNTELSVSVAPTVATAFVDGLDYLSTFPYGCAEQTVSGFLPNIALHQLSEYGAFTTLTDAQLRSKVEAGLTRLYAFQRPDGGFGFWEGSPKSDPYLSAYVLWGMQRANAAGYSVDSNVQRRSADYLRGALRIASPTQTLDSATRSFILFVLAEGGERDQSLLNNLYDRRSELPLFGKAYLAMAYQDVAGNASSQKAQGLLREILDVAKIEARGAHFEEASARAYAPLMHTNTRTTAIVLEAVLRISPDHPLAPNIVRWLLSTRRAGHWDTTQSTSQALLALVSYLQETGELKKPVTAHVSFDGKKLIDTDFAAGELTRIVEELSSDKLPAGRDAELRMTAEGGGRLYYDAELSTFWKQDVIPAAEEGMGILREIEPLDAKSGMRAGTLHRVRLTITVPEDRHFVAVESPLIAGFEPIDLSLATSQQGLLEDEVNHSDNWYDDWMSGIWRFSHIEFRDDRVFLFAEDLPAGVYRYEYLVRAALPGTYRQRPARAWEMYYPEVYGQTVGDVVEVKE